ncbi:hypothetical protein K0M31_007999 [Melipona bicolor]|uniref:Uncharacterized protein n=1 Tax=Melipona bicolor TaxID=60889 RepID=A0AA40GCR7_9HYME|nr:hypothetical protein K0M31_007999 [Melipona bicolor]
MDLVEGSLEHENLTAIYANIRLLASSVHARPSSILPSTFDHALVVGVCTCITLAEWLCSKISSEGGEVSSERGKLKKKRRTSCAAYRVTATIPLNGAVIKRKLIQISALESLCRIPVTRIARRYVEYNNLILFAERVRGPRGEESLAILKSAKSLNSEGENPINGWVKDEDTKGEGGWKSEGRLRAIPRAEEVARMGPLLVAV